MSHAAHHPNQFDLFKTRRFLPLFTTQFLGAFNDNLLKNAFIVLISFHNLHLFGINTALMVQLNSALFILPFFLFSATAGELAEKFDKAAVARWVKGVEILIMLLAALGFWRNDPAILLSCIFLMGVHSAIFGPLKYSVLPQYLKDHELIGGNGLIEMGTFIAILLGQIAGTVMISQPGGVEMIMISTVAIAVLGYLSSRAMPEVAPTAPNLPLNMNIARETWRIIAHCKQNRAVFLSIMGISWFWFYGALLLSQLPEYAKSTLGGNEQVYTLLMTLFSIGVGSGSALCEKLSGRKLELGLVPFGAIGMAFFGIDMYFGAPALGATKVGFMAFIQHASNYRVMIDLTLLGMFGGFFIVPLYAIVQQRTEPAYRSRAIAANNILNSLFMVVAAGMAAGLLAAGLSIPEILLVTSILHLIVSIYIFSLLPEFLMRFLVWMFTHTLYRVNKQGLAHIPDEGAAVIVSNHVSYMDALIIAGACPRPIRFVMNYRVFKIPLLNFIFRTAKAIPIASAKENPALKAEAYAQIAAALAAGELVCLFPEGRLTLDGEIAAFKPGIEDILAQSPVPVIPLALSGMWGSVFSQKGGEALTHFPRRFWSKVRLTIAPPVPASEAKAATLHAQVAQLRGEVK